MREFEVYNAYYCAICHAVKRRYGELPRLMLSYDAAFIAMLAAGLAGGPEAMSFQTFRCFNHPAKKRNEAVPSSAIDYAADVMVFLGWLGLKDGKADGDAANPLKGALTFAGETLLRSAGCLAGERLGNKALVCRECLHEQQTLEDAKTKSLDHAADPTGRIMAELLDFTDAPGLAENFSADISQNLRDIGYHLGRYIYIIDAVDDLEKDRKSGAYNPLLLRPESPDALKTAAMLDFSSIGENMGLLTFVYHKSIIDNIVYLGLHARLDGALQVSGGTHEGGYQG